MGSNSTVKHVRTLWDACSKQAGMRCIESALQPNNLHNNTVVMYVEAESFELLYTPRDNHQSFIPQDLQLKKA